VGGFITKCKEHDKIMGQCRCMCEPKTVQYIDCCDPEHKYQAQIDEMLLGRESNG